MYTTREIILLLAGAQTFHTFSHILFMFSGSLPVRVFGINFTEKFNLWCVIINAVITIALFWWASTL